MREQFIILLIVIGIVTVLHKTDVKAEPTPLTTFQGAARVIDGDTVVVGGIHIRLKGVDAPELSNPDGIEAKLKMQEIAGTWLTCRVTGEKTYNREVGWCDNASGQDIGAEIILAGRALACPHYDRRYVRLEQPEAVGRLHRAPYCLR
jgi:endonuclease YncB( thermonuclease family)